MISVQGKVSKSHVVRAVPGVKQVGVGTFDRSSGGQAESCDEGEKCRVDHTGWLSGIGLTFFRGTGRVLSPCVCGWDIYIVLWAHLLAH